MRYAIWEVGGTEPVSIHDTTDQATVALADLVRDGFSTRDFCIRPYSDNTHDALPGGVTLHFIPNRKNP